MIRFRKMGVTSDTTSVVTGPNGQQEERRSYAITLLPVNGDGDALMLGGATYGPGSVNGKITIPVESEEAMNLFPDGAMLTLALEGGANAAPMTTARTAGAVAGAGTLAGDAKL